MNAFKLKHALPCDRVKNAFLWFSYSVRYLQAMAILTECKMLVSSVQHPGQKWKRREKYDCEREREEEENFQLSSVHL